VRACRAIFHRLRLTVGFIPNQVGPQVPAVGLHRKSQLPRHSNEVFWLEAVGCRCTIGHSATFVLCVVVSPCSSAAGIAIANVQPQCSIHRKSPADLPENCDEFCDVFIDVRLCADLAFHTIIAKPPIRRGGHNGLEQAFREAGQNAACIADQNLAEIATVL